MLGRLNIRRSCFRFYLYLYLACIIELSVLGQQCSLFLEDSDYPGNDIKSTLRTNPEECCIDCQATESCKLYVWNPVGVCYLKSAPSQRYHATGAKAAFIAPALQPNAKCNTVEQNTDYLGNDIVAFPRSSADVCCSDCAATPGCQLYVWKPTNTTGTTEDGSGGGICQLKYAGGKKTTLIGATAASIYVPIDGCGELLGGVSYEGGYIIGRISRPAPQSCCSACRITPGCQLFVWVPINTGAGVGQCQLMSEVGDPIAMPGAWSAIVKDPKPPVNTTAPRQVVLKRVGTFPQPTLVFHTMRASMWVHPAETTIVRHHSHSRKGKEEDDNDAADDVPMMWNILTDSPPLLNATEAMALHCHHSLATDGSNDEKEEDYDAFGMSSIFQYFVLVQSSGECARITRTHGYTFFSYVQKTRICIVHDFEDAPESELFLAATTTASNMASVIAVRQKLPPSSQIRNISTTIPSALSCHNACVRYRECAAVAFSMDNGRSICTFYAPFASNADVTAGWVHDPIQWHEVTPRNRDLASSSSIFSSSSSMQYLTMPWRNLPLTRDHCFLNSNLVVSHVGACAVATSKRPNAVIFIYSDMNRSCTIIEPNMTDEDCDDDHDASKTIELILSPASPVVIPSHLRIDHLNLTKKIVPEIHSANACYRLCLPSQDNCFGSIYDGPTRVCVLVSPPFDASATLGWLAPRRLPLLRDAHMEQVQFYVTAHQDDHELFMASNLQRDLSNPTTKVVFVYTTAGDAGVTDGWWQAREAATLAGTQEWVKLYGHFHPVSMRETVKVGRQKLAKVTIGNAVHYFLRLTESGLENLVHGTIATTVGQPLARYENIAAVEAVLRAILKLESIKISIAGVHTSAFQDTWDDHALHLLTGKMVSNAIATDTMLSKCMSQTYYFGYQHWFDTVNMVEPGLGFQRQLWLSLSYTASWLYPQWFIWPLHVDVLGREYIASAKHASMPCRFK